MPRYVCEGNEIYINDDSRVWVASFMFEEDCIAMCESFNLIYEKEQAIEKLSELEPALC